MQQSGKSVRTHCLRYLPFYFASLLSIIILVGCANQPNGYGANPNSAAPGNYRTTSSQPQVDDRSQAMQDYARQANAAFNHTQPQPPVQHRPVQQQQQQTSQVEWLEPAPHARMDIADQAVSTQQPATRSAIQPQSNQSIVKTSDPSAPAQTKELTRAQMLDLLEVKIRNSDQPAFDKAIALVTVGSIDQSNRFTEADLAQLTASERKLVEGYKNSLQAIHASIDNEDEMVNVNQLTEQISGAFGRQPITIRRIELVRRIDGYGVFEAFAKHPDPDDKDQLVTTFLAGRPHKVGIYVEIDNFHSLKQSTGQWQVMLEHELELFNESDGLRVWHQPRMQVVDHCSNKRRDFFYRQLVTLPANLGVGKYLLKVRVTDLNGQSIYEQVVPLHYVADKSMTRTSASPYMDQGLILPQR